MARPRDRAGPALSLGRGAQPGGRLFRLLLARAATPAPLARLAAYPNPAADELTLEATDARPLTGNWTLYDLLGRAVRNGALPGGPRPRLSLAGLPADGYLLRIADERRGTIQTLRIVKH